MTSTQRARDLGIVCAAWLTLMGCSGGVADAPSSRGPFRVALASTGFGQIFPYRIRQADSFGNPTATVLNIESLETLKANIGPNNPVLPVANFGTTPSLPDGNPGNQFLHVQFTHALLPESILSTAPAGATNSGLTTALSLLAYDPFTEQTQVMQGRGFVGGYTVAARGGSLQLVQAVRQTDGGPVVESPEGAGFPLGFSGAEALVSPNSFVFVADTDDDLTTFETFPANRLMRILVSNAVRSSVNKVLEHEVCTATTVGADPNPPDVLGAVGGGTLSIMPGNGAANVETTTRILVQFNKPVQPSDVGSFFDASNLVPASGGVSLGVTAAASTFSVPYYADPVGFGDFCNYIITPSYPLPGSPPAPSSPTQVNVTVNQANVRSLGLTTLGNSVTTAFTTGTGQGLINAPVAPEAMYIGMGGTSPGVSVIDLNGLGQGTGDINDTRFPLNPNVGVPGVDPALAPGSSNVDAGSAGAFTLTQDSSGNTRLLSDPLVGQIGDIHIGAPLDLIFNNDNINRNAISANQENPIQQVNQPGNTISVSPHPNPPRLIFPPPNPARSIYSEEPTKTSSAGPLVSVLVNSPPCQASPINLLGVGNPNAPSSNPAGLGVLGALMPGQFYGPQPPPGSPPPPTPYCPFTSRQQIGHFLYVLDRDNRQILVVNSNRMTVLDSIRLTDPFDMAMAPNLRVLAVSNFASSSVSFIDIDPFSPTFHEVIGETRVDAGPTRIAWQPDGEVVVVVSPTSSTASILSALDFSLQKTLSGFLNEPIDVALTPRYQNTGHVSGVFFGYILNADGTIAVYESGPDGVNGIGFNDIIGIVPGEAFRGARKLLLDPTSAVGAVFVAHADASDLGQVSRLELTSSPTGPLALNQSQGGQTLSPTFRQKTWTVVQRFGGSAASTPTRDQFSGNAVVDIALDEVLNAGASVDQVTPFNANVPLPSFGHSSKGFIKNIFATFNSPAPYYPRYLFAAVADRGVVDVMDLNSGRKIATIPVDGIPRVLGQYWRQ